MSSADIGDPGHGNSPAAWVAVIIMLVAFVIGTFAFWFESLWMVWVAGVLLVIGPISGWILARLGYGVDGPRYQPKNSH
ncbi:MAG TPA: DUF6704 family protein [Terrimesophilobacter sp.]|jgi:hypothetical protein|uniref:DUF6704 family protein n=1 Tax=Terrimesophilobacter sp. TaxID=2906435 RepID=UPI002F9380E4